MIEPKESQHDPLIIHDWTRIPATPREAIDDIAETIVETTGRQVTASEIAGVWDAGV